MKILLTATSPSIDSPVDPRFGRGAYLIVVDPVTMEWQAHANPGIDAASGAGTQAAQFAANLRVSTVISGDFGPNACNVLHAAGVTMYLLGMDSTVRQNIELFKSGQLTHIDTPTTPRRHSLNK